MFILSSIASALVAATVVSAWDSGAKLDKPALRSNLDYLNQGLVDHLPETSFTKDQWGAGWIPEECKHIVTGNLFDNVNFNPADFNIWNIHYSDCGDAWVFCHHKDSPITIDSMAQQFGKVPIQMRQWIRHVIDVPSDSGWAFEWDGTITFLGPVPNMLSVILHETGHSLDLSGAYADNPLSASDNWWNNYNQDSHVPDNYAQSNAIEDVAQNTVVAVFNENVPGGFGTVEPEWNNLFHQYATLISEANAAGKGNSLIVPGENEQCTHRMPPSAPVSVDGKKRRGVQARRGAPKVGLSEHIIPILTGRNGQDKHSNCSLSW